MIFRRPHVRRRFCWVVRDVRAADSILIFLEGLKNMTVPYGPGTGVVHHQAPITFLLSSSRNSSDRRGRTTKSVSPKNSWTFHQ